MGVPSEFGVQEHDLTRIEHANDLKLARDSANRIMRDVEQCGYSSEIVFAIKLALEEALTNAIKHGNENDPDKTLTILYTVDHDRAVIMVRDQGTGFSPDDVPDPTADENLLRPSGRGLMLMHAYMTRVHFNDRGNEVWMLKRNASGAPDVSAASG